MLAQKQPYIQRVRNSSLVEWFCAENLTGLNDTPKLRNSKELVEEHCIREEAVPKGAVDFIDVYKRQVLSRQSG